MNICPSDTKQTGKCAMFPIVKVRSLLLLIHIGRRDRAIKDHQHHSGDFEVHSSKQRPEGMSTVRISLLSESLPSEKKQF